MEIRITYNYNERRTIMTGYKKILTVLLIVFSLFVITGCSKDETAAPDSNQETLVESPDGENKAGDTDQKEAKKAEISAKIKEAEKLAQDIEKNKEALEGKETELTEEEREKMQNEANKMEDQLAELRAEDKKIEEAILKAQSRSGSASSPYSPEGSTEKLTEKPSSDIQIESAP